MCFLFQTLVFNCFICRAQLSFVLKSRLTIKSPRWRWFPSTLKTLIEKCNLVSFKCHFHCSLNSCYDYCRNGNQSEFFHSKSRLFRSFGWLEAVCIHSKATAFVEIDESMKGTTVHVESCQLQFSCETSTSRTVSAAQVHLKFPIKLSSKPLTEFKLQTSILWKQLIWKLLISPLPHKFQHQSDPANACLN